MERYNDTERTSLWVIAGRVVFTVALIACIWFIFSNSMAVATVSTDSSGRVLAWMRIILRRLGQPMAGSKVALERNVRAYDEDRQWQLPEPGVVQSAKVYREKVALPLITRSKELVKNLTIKCVGLMEQVKKLTAKVNQQGEDIAWYKNKIKEQNSTMEHLQEKAEDLERVKQYVGADKIQDIIDNVKEAERLQAEQKRLQRSYQNRVSR